MMPNLPFNNSVEHSLPTRRQALLQGGGGFGALALSFLLQKHPLFRQEAARNPLAAKPPHFAAKAKSVIFLFMEGGPSHLDLFDYKPKLNELAGKPLPSSFGTVLTSMGEQGSPLLASKRKWQQHGQSGLWVSDWLPHLAEHADDLAVLRSCWTDGINHSTGVCQMNTGTPLPGRPCLGSWVSYGLGTENDNLPAFIVMQDSNASTINGPRNWSSGFMPAVYQGIRVNGSGETIANLQTLGDVGPERQQAKLQLLQQINRQHALNHPQLSELDARIAAYELAFRMQAQAPEAIDLAKEAEPTKALYGLDQKETAAFGKMCLMARRLVERGVRFVQLYSGAGSRWDAHAKIEQNHSGLCRSVDKPIAGLLKDLKARGLLDSTLVIWGGEFGRTPMSEKGDGRDHNPYGFTMWLAGGGVKGGQTIGATDDLGLHAVQDRLHVHDLHATILWLLGLDHMRVIYPYKGRPERPTLNEGEAFKKIIG
jgi:hypothetical protein